MARNSSTTRFCHRSHHVAPSRLDGLTFFEDTNDEYGTCSLREIFPLLTPPMGTSWSAKLAASLSPDITRGLKRAWNYRSAGIKNEKKCKAVPLARPEHPFIAWFTTDADIISVAPPWPSSAILRHPLRLRATSLRSV